jgi:hypothetical protein
MAGLDRVPAVLEPAGGNRRKYHVPVSTAENHSSSIPLSRIYLLGFGEGEARLQRLSGLEAISALVDETYLIGIAAALGLSAQVFKKVAELSRTITVSKLTRPRGMEHLDSALHLIECDVRSARINGCQDQREA